MSKSRTDHRMAALILEVERRRKQTGFHDYSYGKLIADTTPEQRQEIVDRYKENRRRATGAAGRFQEADDEMDLRRAKQRLTKGGE